jgi:hypothetical protein
MSHFGSGFKQIIAVLSIFSCAILFIQCTSQTSETQETQPEGIQRAMPEVPELADAMGQLQYYTHKYALAVEAENHELATFYFHEVRASATGIRENIPGYEGYDIARFMGIFLVPTLQPVELALADRNWDEVRKRTIQMVNACNACHNATSHGFIQVTAGWDENPYNQVFSE